MARDDFPMVEAVVELGQFLGMRIRPCPYLDHGTWMFDSQRSVIVAHDLWERLNREVAEVELLSDYAEE